MFASKVASPHTKASEDLGVRVGRRPWQSSDAERTHALPLNAAAFHHDFSTVSTQFAGSVTTRTTTIPLRAVIPAAPAKGGARSSLHDAPADEQEAEPPAEEEAAEETPGTEPVELDEDTLYIEQMEGGPDVEGTGGIADSINAGFSYSETIDKGAVTMAADDFGATEAVLRRFSDVRIAKDAGTFLVTADVKQTITWNTRDTLGPNSQVSIASENDAALTSANYTTAASDLTPNLSDLNGRPPRTKFWAKDLTEVHERYHVKEFDDVVRSGAMNAGLWLSTQSAATKNEVKALMTTAWETKLRDPKHAVAALPGAEERAYDAGVAAYKTRAEAIKKRGDKGAAGGYPAPPP
jgi:hypothetical protein